MMPKAQESLFSVLAAFIVTICANAVCAQEKPNILITWGDDVGMWDISACPRGMVGSAPNIVRIAKEGMVFMDNYAQASCTAGGLRSLPVTIRTGLIDDPRRFTIMHS